MQALPSRYMAHKEVDSTVYRSGFSKNIGKKPQSSVVVYQITATVLYFEIK